MTRLVFKLHKKAILGALVQEVGSSKASISFRVPCLTSWNIKRKVWTEAGSTHLFGAYLLVLFKAGPFNNIWFV